VENATLLHDSEAVEHPYARFLHSVEKPTRYTGREHGARVKDWSEVDARVCLAFPEVYDIGMSHLGYRILYRILNDHPRLLAERCYAPWTDLVEKLREHGEFLRSLETYRPLCDFDVVGFSLQFELTYTNVLMMLELSGIPLRSDKRGDADPLVIAGGPVATHAEPVAPFFDAIAIGDGEELLTEVAMSWAAGKREGLSRLERLRRLAHIPGVYVPSLYTTAVDLDSGLEVVTGPKAGEDAPFPIQRRLLEDLDRFPFPDDGPVGGPEAVFDRMSIEVARGCTEGCRFCQAGMIYRPVRERDPEKIVATIESALKKTGQDEVSLTALSTADVSCISPLIKRVVEKTAPERVSLSVASLRAYGLAEDLLDDMRKVRTAGLTFAPEAGTQRMRDVVNKNVTEAQLLETAERVFTRGFDKMKLYFMIGLPTEQEEDVRGIVQVGKNAHGVAKRVKNHRARVTVSVSTHVPKPHTPFQWCAMDPLQTIREKQDILRSEVRGHRGVQLRTHDPETSVLEGVLARGDRRLADAIEDAFRSGAVFDSWEEHHDADAWQKAFERFGVEAAHYLGTIPVSARLPWDHFDIGLEDGFLLREYRKALANRLSPPCGKAKGDFIHHTNVRDAEGDGRKLVCYDCGIGCDLDQMKVERVDSLRRMNALEPGQRVRLPVLQEGPLPALRKALPEPERNRPTQAGGTAARYRLCFEKLGPIALLGHLDLLRELPRVIRRAGIRTQYTRGFHPTPEISFGPALSLGVLSMGEYADMKLIGATEADEVLLRLREAAPPGLGFLSATRLSDKEPSIGKLIVGASYLMAFDAAALEEELGMPRVDVERTLEERFARFDAETTLTVARVHKGITKRIDVRGGTRRVALARDVGPLLRRIGVGGNRLTLVAETVIAPNGSVRLDEIAAAFGLKSPFRAVRTRLTLRDPLDEGTTTTSSVVAAE
jgi:radical SAM family uncharacterized protein/radical SAM-linked protein